MSNLIKIEVSRDKMTATIKVEESDQPLTREDIISALKNSGIVYGIFEDVVEISSTSTFEDAMIIAKGDPPVQGKHGWVEILWKEKEEVGKVSDPDRIDFRETSDLISVNEGTLLAQRHPPQEGTSGKAVTGEEAKPAQLKTSRLMAGKGAKLDDQGDRVFSTTQGRPVAKMAGPSASISVEPVYTITGDVCLKTGNIRFKGDVIVNGSVTETMKLEASGSVTVSGIITGAHVSCGKNLIVQKNIISSNVFAGIGAVECGKIRYLIQDVYDDLGKLLQVIEQLKGQSA
ncbi:MAG: DUF342 domain-containing protein, partial [Desulfocucumaceae bacterium]